MTGEAVVRDVTLYGAVYSVYVRIARMVLEEARVPYDLVEVDIFTPAAVPSDYAGRHPFGKIPAFEHDGFRLFETDAIAAYAIDLSHDKSLVPANAREHARMIQIMRIMDHYAYPRLVWGVFVEEIERGRAGQLNDAEIESARHTLAVLDDLAGDPYLVGARLTLADLWAFPMLSYLRLAPTGQKLIAQFPKIAAWMATIDRRPSARVTRFPREGESGPDGPGQD
jgi:glutathione S-transferase